MTLVKRATAALFLATAGVIVSLPVMTTPAYAATTPQQVIDLIDIRIAQLTQIRADQQAIAQDTNNSNEVRIAAQAASQQAFIRILQLTALKNQVPFFPMATLDALANQLRAIISAS